MPVRLIWSLSGSGLGTTLSANGNSGAYQTTGPPPWTPNYLSAVDLRYIDDVWMTVSVTAVTSSPSLVVKLNVFDDLGNTFAAYAFTAITAAGSAQVSLGKHGSAATAYIVFPAWGQVLWTCSGGTTTGTEISLWGR
jgi:hypothetical protein